MENALPFQPNIFANVKKPKAKLAKLHEKKAKIKSVVKRMKAVQQDKLDTFMQDKLELLKRS